MQETQTKSNQKYVYAHGRRKEAVARARLYKGKGQNLINGKPMEEYFPSDVAKSKFFQPFNLTKTESSYFVSVKVEGSGKAGQLHAVIHAVSSALNIANPEFRPMLKQAGLLTRDSRVKERRKYGNAQKARKGKQSPKR